MVPSAIWRIKSLHKSPLSLSLSPPQIEKRCSHFDFPLWKYIKLKAPLKFAETMVLLYSIMQFLQELES